MIVFFLNFISIVFFAEKCIAKSDSTQDFTLYNRLSPTDQNLVKRIGSMGFPLERVAAVLARIGNDDKKVSEIPCSTVAQKGVLFLVISKNSQQVFHLNLHLQTILIYYPKMTILGHTTFLNIFVDRCSSPYCFTNRSWNT